MNEALKAGYPVVGVCSQKIVDLGFNPNYCLSVLKTSNKGIEFRNSWGTIIERPKINIGKEGNFEFNNNQVRDYIDYFLIAETDSYLTTTIQSKHCGSFYSCYSFKLKKDNPNALISVAQFDRRLFSTKFTYNYAPFRVIVERKGTQKDRSDYEYIGAAFTHNSRNL